MKLNIFISVSLVLPANKEIDKCEDWGKYPSNRKKIPPRNKSVTLAMSVATMCHLLLTKSAWYSQYVCPAAQPEDLNFLKYL
jgi:hypothetical protein